MYIIAVLIGKATLAVMRLGGRTGSALPGLVVEKLYKPFLRKSLSNLPNGVIMVTGTNGKTTTTRLISGLFAAHGLRTLTNHTGSNFVRGVISTVLSKVTLTGRLPYDIAVIEQDEAHALLFVKEVKPVGVVALNVMRDQMDRFGEIDYTATLIKKTVAAADKWVVLNANDARIAEASKDLAAANVVWFGHHKKLLNRFITDDQHHHEDDLTFYEAAKPDVMLVDLQADRLSLVIDGYKREFKVKLSGNHNAINVAAALAAVKAAVPNASLEVTTKALASISPSFGRGENVILPSGRELNIQLVKNPASFTHCLRILDNQPYKHIGIAINDSYADSRDVSWLWDVDFKKIGKAKIQCGGSRAADMALRLKYDGIMVSSYSHTLNDFLAPFLQPGPAAIIFCTYTAMLNIRKELEHSGAQMERVRV